MSEPTDPTRIPRVIAALQRAWEGQPDLALPALLGLVANRGVGWGSSDEDFLATLEQVEREHPSLVDAPPTRHLSIATFAPRHLVTLTPDRVVVRDPHVPTRQPVAWAYSALRPTGPGRPLVITDVAGVEHRLGVSSLVSEFDPHSVPPLSGIRAQNIGEARWLVEFADGSRALVAPRLRVWRVNRRDVELHTVAWERIDRCSPGAAMAVTPVGGRGLLELGEVDNVTVIQA
ncbi:hypothetical protein CAPI_01325 [Corynebacterium capitovis DSM 44611]|uniref:hypothetical protein n=1 Tax=Corynebacterium capitovis TaxID=131081 RepID=UPI00036B4DAC|nr:hypothetical protein [Corynebacterium capitovis]WKD56839.1 hypothetical protein CAPI_01325 [Corynebacterium capitovis DSM 44611]